MYRHRFTIKNPQGVHLKPSTEIAKLSLEYPELEIKITKVGLNKTVEANSVMSILSLELTPNAEIEVEMNEKNDEVISRLEKFIS